MRRAIAAALAAVCVLTLGGREIFAGDDLPGDKLPEPALQFAKEATRHLTEAEREWTKMAERLAKCQADFAVADRTDSDGFLRDEAGRLLTSAKKLLADRKQMSTDLDRFQVALNKAAENYREVAALYKSHADKAKSGEVKEDYRELAKAYERKATAAAERGRKIGMPSGTETKADVIDEGNLFLERLLEALTVGPMTQAERGAIAARLRKHGERCKALAEELRRSAETLLQDSDSPEFRRPAGASAKTVGSLDGASWSAPVTVAGAKCVTVIRFDKGGTCSQSTYAVGPNGKRQLVGFGSGSYRMDAGGTLSFYQAGMQVETGTATFLGKDQWSYRILNNVLESKLAGQQLLFTREP
ncbi:MAG: hypothetical protein K1X57_09230 [Gemmataceae bacterium]|nr:hypothetical protein [Gemmataceae bacterium]